MTERHKEIIRLRKELFTYKQIAGELGCSYTLPHKVLKKYAPELMGSSTGLRVRAKLERMIILRGEGLTYSAIASNVGFSKSTVEHSIRRFAPELTRPSDVGFSKSTVEHSIRRFAPELTRRPITKKDQIRRVEKVAKLQRRGLKNREIAERLGITKGIVDSDLMRAKETNIPLITKRKSYPKLNSRQMEERDRKIVELYKQGMPVPDIAKGFGIVGSRIYQIIEKELPELRVRKQRELEKRNREILKMVKAGKSCDEIADRFGLGVSTVRMVVHTAKKRNQKD